MNSFPEDDYPLKNFLQQNRPPIPPAAANLEEQILALVEETPQEVEVAKVSRRSQIRGHVKWLIPSAIAAGFVAIAVGYRSLTPTQPDEVELVELQEFIESTWHGTVAEYPTTTAEELYPLTDEASVN